MSGRAGEPLPLTRSFTDLVQSHVARDPDFAAALRREEIEMMLIGDDRGGRQRHAFQ